MGQEENFPSRSLSSRQPNVVMVTKMEQMPSRRTANHLEVVRKRNQAAVDAEESVLLDWMCDVLHTHQQVELQLRTANLSAGPGGRRRFSGTSPRRRRLGWSTGPEETRTGGRRRDSELQDRKTDGVDAVSPCGQETHTHI